jgi:hypothetical protein
MTDRTIKASRIRRPLMLLAVFLVLGAACLGAVAYTASAGSPGTDATEAGLSYSRTVMQWIHGPSIVHTRAISLAALPALLPHLTTPALRDDVNTSDLIRHFGPRRQVEVMVLSGTYNSLPPDEGVNIQGEVILLVDRKTNKVLFLTD